MQLKTVFVCLFIFLSLLIENNFAAERKSIFSSPKNLKVLPKDIKPEQLAEKMKSITLGLGLRCHHCHVGEANKPLQTYDFAADDKALKKKARIMLKMVKQLNEVEVRKLDQIAAADRVEIRCVTCHRGQQKPRLIQDVLSEQFAEKGISGVINSYAELRKKYYGGHTFDFSENVLPMFAQSQLSQPQSHDDAVKLLEANSQYFPDSYFGFFSLGAAYQAKGNNAKAREAYEKALQLNPKAVFIKKRIDSLAKTPGGQK
ncbi:c-type cytochrome [Aliikangiella coralliicola]|uniref:Photosynthetic reaction center cytochrome c subunit n=1 Tax=Aliikangiella coralliicola TaxID=2592383 RepID=A0A545UI21_9GAMM|nr:c-type cytochrome [Aliikangiella coralliicola]TQV89117.1 c-type cytochrome [Aliikangiella coralliicola]